METKTKLNDKLLMFQRNINVIKKDGKNPHFKSSYATLQQILSEVKPVLTDLGLILTQPVCGQKVQTVITDSETGDKIESSIDLPAGLNPQQAGSAITYYRRYLLAGLLALEIEDDDGNVASTEVDNRPWLNENTEEFNKVVAYLAKPDSKIADVEKKYRLSKKVKESLMSQAV